MEEKDGLSIELLELVDNFANGDINGPHRRQKLDSGGAHSGMQFLHLLFVVVCGGDGLVWCVEGEEDKLGHSRPVAENVASSAAPVESAVLVGVILHSEWFVIQEVV